MAMVIMSSYQIQYYINMNMYYIPIKHLPVQLFIKDELISPNQLGFKPRDSCINQVLAITHEIYKSFDDGFEVI